MLRSSLKYVLLCTVAISCTHTNNMTLTSENFDWQGHRGCRGLMPENSVPGMLKALDLGVTTLEMDAVVTADKQVILSHEPYFNHEITTKANGSYVTQQEEASLNIYKMTFAQTQQYDVGLKPHPRFPWQTKMAAKKPLLSAVINSAEAHAVAAKRRLPLYNIETKSKPHSDNIYHPAPKEYVELIMQVVNEKKITERTMIQSFDVRTLQYMHTAYPKVQLVLLIESIDTRDPATQIAQLGFTPQVYSPDLGLVTPMLVKQCKDMGMRLIPYTINDAVQMKKFIEMGVDGEITDYPNLIIR